MRKNKRGFALIEILTVTVVVLVIFTMLYANLFPLIGEYEKRVVYNDVETQYVSFYMRKLYKDVSINLGEQGYVVLYKDKQCTLLSGDAKKKCEDIASSSELVSMIVTNKSLSELKKKLDNNDELTELLDYIKYLPNYKKDKTEAYRLILKTKMGYSTTELKVSSYSGEPNAPVLAENMIPVYYDESAKVWKKADQSNSSGQWYDYDSKKWANAVTVKGTNRNTYLSASAGTTIPMEDINTMWVWIPRYKYTSFAKRCGDIENPTESSYPDCYFWIYDDKYKDAIKERLLEMDVVNVEAAIDSWSRGLGADLLGNGNEYAFSAFVNSDKELQSKMPDAKKFISDNYLLTSQKQQIDIKFENGKKSTGTVKCTEKIGYLGSMRSETCTDSRHGRIISGKSTYTHPAFTFGDQELTGIWVGKFLNSTDDDSQYVQILPNTRVKFWNLDQAFEKIRSMESLGNPFGFSQTGKTVNSVTGEIENDSNKLDTHLMKNMEWGAVAYLSHSKYGTCDNGNCAPVYSNNNVHNPIITSDPFEVGFITGNSGSKEQSESSSKIENAYDSVRVDKSIVEGTGKEITPSKIDKGDFDYIDSSKEYQFWDERGYNDSELTFDFSFSKESVVSFDYKSNCGSSCEFKYTLTKNGSLVSSGEASNTGDNFRSERFILSAGDYSLTFSTFHLTFDLFATVKNIQFLEGPKINTNVTYLGAKASTTHTIYGIYDMRWMGQYVMGNVFDSSNSFFSFTSTSRWTSDKKPLDKYYDKYSNQYPYYMLGKTGDATSELGVNKTKDGIYSWDKNSISVGRGWITRGLSSGIFSYGYKYGASNEEKGSRSVLAIWD